MVTEIFFHVDPSACLPANKSFVSKLSLMKESRNHCICLTIRSTEKITSSPLWKTVCHWNLNICFWHSLLYRFRKNEKSARIDFEHNHPLLETENNPNDQAGGFASPTLLDKYSSNWNSLSLCAYFNRNDKNEIWDECVRVSTLVQPHGGSGLFVCTD